MIYWILHFGLKVFFWIKFSAKIYGAEKVPAGGPLLIASNHVTNWDPFLVHRAVPIRMAFMAKEELFKIPVLSWIMKNEKVIPVRRGAADRNAIRLAIAALKSERVLGIFPEGTRNKSGELQEFQPGMTMLAVKAQCGVLPTWLEWSNRGTVQVYIGDLIYPPAEDASKEEQVAFTEKVRNEIFELGKKAKEG